MNRISARLLALVPLLVLVFFAASYSINMPYWDCWSLAPLINKFCAGTLSFRDLFEQHNENRILIPRLIMIPLAWLTGWNVYYEIAGIVLATCLTFLVLVRQSLRAGQAQPWLILLVSALVFSLLQYECWSIGFTLVGSISIVCVVSGLALLCRSPFSWLNFSGALLAGAAASFSYANGIIFWPAGIAALLVLAREERRRLAPQFCIWILTAGIVLWLYFAGYHHPGYHPSLWFFREHPGQFLGYLCAFLGGGVFNLPRIPESLPDGAAYISAYAPLAPLAAPIAVGAIGLTIFTVCSLAVFLRAGRGLSAVAFWPALGAYAVLSGIAAAQGRSSGWGMAQALVSRYTMFSSLFWAATLVLAVIVVRHFAQARTATGRRVIVVVKYSLIFFAAACALSFIASSVLAAKAWQQRHDYLGPVRNELLTFAPDETLLGRIFPSPGTLRPWLDLMAARKMTVFRERKPFSEYRVVQGEAGEVVSYFGDDLLPGKILAGGIVHIHGWSIAHERRAVLLVNSNGVIIARADVGLERNIAYLSIHPLFRREIEWTLTLSSVKLPPGQSALAVYALYNDNRRVSSIGELTVEVVPIGALKTLFQLEFDDNPPDNTGYFDNCFLDGETIYAKGWARNPFANQPGQWVVAVNQATDIVAYARVADDCADLYNLFHDVRLIPCGWRMAIHKNAVGAGTNRLSAYLLLPEEKKALRLKNEFRMIVP